ncbi:heavy metal-binding domain-containing protein [Streptomyces sp. NPDC048507]|uniref:heavy metal-binding domain-containing protein n=1 Tax=Streptomyces sp. NPDC048507 TaxID=3365560 RepID=UPI003721E4FA
MTHPRADGATADGDRTWDALLSAPELAAVTSAGFDPLGSVWGVTVNSIGNSGLWGCPGAWPGPSAAGYPKTSSWTPSYARLMQELYAARKQALRRAVEQCRALGGDGIVGVSLEVGEPPPGGVSYTVRGTAVRARSRIRPHQPFTSHLGGQDFARLIHSGWVPTGLAFGIAVHGRHDDWRTTRRTRWTAPNGEVEGYTLLVSRARQEARTRLARDAAASGGEGVVVDRIDLTVDEGECVGLFGNGYAHDFSVEAAFVGTAVARFGRSVRPAGSAPLTFMRLDREH